MKTLMTISSICLTALLVAVGVVWTSEVRANRDLRETNLRLEAELHAAQEESRTLRAEHEAVSTQLAVAQETAAELQSQLAGQDSPDDSEVQLETAPLFNPFPAQAYLGQRHLGQAWIIPRNIRKDPKTQSYVYEPVIWLDENLRKGFVTHHTNIVEREVESRTYVNTIQYPQPVYYGYRPIYGRPPTNSYPPAPHLPNPPITQPSLPNINSGSGLLVPQKIWRPSDLNRRQP
ncbi:MAG: hypothetical protein KIS67_16560 [Verrucomicrobiae bacterium]|nr:hypothetical protein [Verrucomicrobiae bacterium]